jgi:hypothetical protein
VMITVGDEVKKLLREKIESREWWILIPETDCHYLVVEAEERFYNGKASADFAAVLGMSEFGIFSIYAAHKRRMSAQDLLTLIGTRSQLPVSLSQLEKHDIIFLAGWAQSQVLLAQLAQLLDY